jgi:hypothetical protein
MHADSLLLQAQDTLGLVRKVGTAARAALHESPPFTPLFRLNRSRPL